MKALFARVLVDHYASMPRSWCWFVHLLPLTALVPFAYGFTPTEQQLSAVITAVSIYSALLFGILVPAGDQARRMRQALQAAPADSTSDKLERNRLKIHKDVAESILANVAFSIIVSLFNVLLLVVTFCARPREAYFSFLGEQALPVGYVLLLYASSYFFVFMLLLLLVIVRTVYGSWMEEA